MLKVKGQHLYTAAYRETQTSYQQRFTIGNDTSGAEQVAAAHCPNERTLDPAVCS